MKRRNELNMKPAAVIHMLSPRNFKIGSYTRSPHVGGLATVSRHPAVVHAGGVSIYISIYIHITHLYYIHMHIYLSDFYGLLSERLCCRSFFDVRESGPLALHSRLARARVQ